LVGGALAIAAIVAFPTWERDLLPPRLAALLAAYRSYVRGLADPGMSVDQLQRERSACRVARLNAQASLDRVSAQPVPAAASVELGRAVLAHTHRFVYATLAMDTVRTTVLRAGGTPELGVFMQLVDAALGAAHDAVVGARPPQQVPRLRVAQEQMAAALDEQPESVGGSETAAVLVDASDRMTDSLNTLLAELRRQFGSARAPMPAQHEQRLITG
jgi:hypothetical protein